MREHGADQRNIASKLLAFEILGELLASTEASQLPQNIVDQIRGLTGAKTVLLIVHPAESQPHDLVFACPLRRKDLFLQEEWDALCIRDISANIPPCVKEIPESHRLKKMLERVGIETILRFPLRAATEWVGTLVLLQMPEPDRLDDVSETLRPLLPLVSMALKNALNHIELEKEAERLEIRVQERTLELVQHQENRQAILRTAMDGFCLLDFQGKILEVNETLCRMSGYNADELCSMTVLELECADTYAKIQIHFENVKSMGQDRFESCHQRKDGSQYAVEVSVQRQDMEGGRLVAFFRDISLRKQSEKQILHTLQEKEALISELFHRTKNTIQVIRGLLVLQAEKYSASEQVQQLVKVTEERIQSISLVQQMLFHSQNLSRIPVREYFEKILEMLHGNYRNTAERIQIENNMEHIELLMDIAAPLGIILTELITNSYQHGFPEGRSGKICVSLRRQSKGGYILDYEDTGVGMGEGFVFHRGQSFGLDLIHEIGEKQLKGSVVVRGESGFSCKIEIPDNLYKARV